ncbi:hypothetical protein BZA77DRAFT_349162 [Pyronema omphalodes]|nr:hypothetical protein BZA77DRAFT_349162 [Pyronema omphalodes]
MSNPPNSPDSNETPPSTSPHPRPQHIPASHIPSSHPHIPTSSDLLRIPPLNSPPFHTPLLPRPSASPYIESKIQQILQSFPDSWLLPPESGETFPSKQDAIQRMQAYGFSAGVAFYPEYKRFGRGDKMRFRCVHFHPKWEPRRIVQRFQTDMFAKRKLVIRVVRSFSENLGVRSIGLGCRYRVDLRGKSRDGDIGGEKDVWVLGM